MEMEVSRLDENEREQGEVLQDEALLTEETQEEAPEALPPEEEAAREGEEEEAEEGQPEAEAETAKPIKGPGGGAWAAAALVTLFALVMAVPAMWNTTLAMTAAGGLLNEAGKNYQSALSTYEFLYLTDMRTGGWELGLTSGEFTIERQYVIQNKLNGPLNIVQSGNMPRPAEVFNRVPRSLRKLSAQYDVIADIFDGIDAHLMMAAEDLSTAEWLLEGLEAARGADELAQERSLYYDSFALHIAAEDPDQKQANQARLAALKKEPGAEPWMYETIELDYAIQDRDYAKVIALSNARLEKNREDVDAMRYNVKAIFREEGAEKAFAAADLFARRPITAQAMQLVKADIYCVQGSYNDALLLCDGILGRAGLTAPIGTSEQAQDLFYALEAVRTKANAQLAMGGDAGETRDMLYEAWGLADMQGVGPSMEFFYSLLAAFILEGDAEQAEGLSQQMGYVPQSIIDLQGGKTTIKEILTEGWGGFDV